MEHSILCLRGESIACMGMAGAHVLALPWRELLPGICFAAMRAEAVAMPRHSVVPCRHAAGLTLTALVFPQGLSCPKGLAVQLRCLPLLALLQCHWLYASRGNA